MIFEKGINESSNNFKELLRLIEENPNLPVFPIVGESICEEIEFDIMYNLCKFCKPYIMGYCYYPMGSGKLEMYTEWSKDLVEYDARKKNIKPDQIQWEKAIFVPISVCEK